MAIEAVGLRYSALAGAQGFSNRTNDWHSMENQCYGQSQRAVADGFSAFSRYFQWDFQVIPIHGMEQRSTLTGNFIEQSCSANQAQSIGVGFVLIERVLREL